MRNKIAVLGGCVGMVAAIVHKEIAETQTPVRVRLKEPDWYKFELRETELYAPSLKQPKRCAWKNKYEDLGRK